MSIAVGVERGGIGVVIVVEEMNCRAYLLMRGGCCFEDNNGLYYIVGDNLEIL